MNDAQLREAFHRKRIKRRTGFSTALVVDELGLHHGSFRADIAVIDGCLYGYELKSDVDSLRRLQRQVDGYNSVFDSITMVVADRHVTSVAMHVPAWWGIVRACQGSRGGIHFQTVRRPRQNHLVDDVAVARLLWRDEAAEAVAGLGAKGSILRGARTTLYRYIVNNMNSRELRNLVRTKLQERQDWPSPSQLFRCDGSSQPNAT